MYLRNDIAKLKQDLTIQVNLLDHDLTFKTRWGVFSPRAIDEGTQLFLKHVDIQESDKCLDLGCGYGPIGLAVAKSCPKGEVHMVDKDFIAVELSNTNAKLNNIIMRKLIFQMLFLPLVRLIILIKCYQMCLQKWAESN